MATGSYCRMLSSKNSVQSAGKNALKSNNLSSNNKFQPLDSSEDAACAICGDSTEESEFLLSCITCHQPVNPCCIDPDMPHDVMSYMWSANALANFVCYCHTCSHPGKSSSAAGSIKLDQLSNRITAIKNLLAQRLAVQPTHESAQKSLAPTMTKKGIPRDAFTSGNSP